MKKIFTLIAMAFMAMSVNAQLISWTEDDKASAGTLDGKEFANGDFKIKLTDHPDGKLAIDKNTAYFGTTEEQVKFVARLKSGGKTGAVDVDGEKVTKNFITATIPADGILKIYARTGSNDAENRTVVVTQGETELYNQVVKEADAAKATIGEEEKNVYPVISIEVKAGEALITYPVGSINFYGFEFEAVTSSETTYSVIGTLTGSWETDVDMTQGNDGKYTATIKNVAAGDYEFKVRVNHDWTESYGDGSANVKITVKEAGDVTITFDPETKEITYTGAVAYETPADAVYSIVGTLTGGWDVDVDMTKGEDGTYTATIKDVAAGDYQFKIRVDHAWTTNFGKDGVQDGPNIDVTVATAGDVVITFNPETKDITVSVPTGINSVKAQKTNTVRYNLAGQMVDANYKGVVIENGKKMIQK